MTASPCVGVCRIGADDLCEGCDRTLAEIAAWSGMTEGEREAAMASVALRRDGAGDADGE